MHQTGKFLEILINKVARFDSVFGGKKYVFGLHFSLESTTSRTMCLATVDENLRLGLKMTNHENSKFLKDRPKMNIFHLTFFWQFFTNFEVDPPEMPLELGC